MPLGEPKRGHTPKFKKQAGNGPLPHLQHDSGTQDKLRTPAMATPTMKDVITKTLPFTQKFLGTPDPSFPAKNYPPKKK